VSADPELRSAVRELLPDLAKRAGLAVVKPVRVERRSRDQLVTYLKRKLDEDFPPEEEQRVRRSYELLGLLPPNLDLRGLLLSVYTEQVAGFYDPDSTALFVLDDQPPEALRTVLLHELVHAVQDQHVNLDSLTARDRGNDERTAAESAIEGHATLVMLEYMMQQMQGSDVDLSKVADFSSQLGSALEGISGQYPVLGSAPPVVRDVMLFPYLKGTAYVQRVWNSKGGRPAPFAELLPQSTEQVLDPARLLGPVRDDPVDLALTVSGSTVAYTDGLGELEIGLLLQTLAGTPDGSETVSGWRGDRYALLDGGGPGGSLVWVSVWDDASLRDAFKARLRPHLGKLPEKATLESTTVGGAAALVLRVGQVGKIEVSLVPPGEPKPKSSAP
jgi:hypothetical protein